MIDVTKFSMFLLVLFLLIYMVHLSLYAKRNWHFAANAFRLVFIGLSFLAVATLSDSLRFLESYSFTYLFQRICFAIGGLIFVVGLTFWMSATKKFIGMIEELSIRDPMLSVYNRRGIFQIFEQMTNDTPKFYVILCDLNELKHMNDTLGHNKGDHYIKMTAQIMEDTFGSNGYVSRLGGDEFLILYMEDESSSLNQCIQTIKQQVSHIFDQEQTSISIGTSCFPDEGVTIDTLIKIADGRMYQDKREYKNAKQRLENVM